jgi:hypothetical protein
MSPYRAFTLGAVALVTLAPTPALAAAHDKAFWQAIAADHYHPPVGASVPELSAELSDRLASPDPEWRDDIAYSTLVSWIYQQRLLDADALRPLVTRWLGNLQFHVGTTGSDDVFLRSFSALVLSVVVARDNAAPFLEEHDVRTILDAALGYLAAEQDVRGYVPENGWAHSAAHTSDLLKFLARSRYVRTADQSKILAAFGHKLTATPAVFVFGEDERMARAVLSVVKRGDFDLDGFRTWVTAITPKFPPPTALSLTSLQAFQNLKNLLTKLEVLVAMDEPKSDAEQRALDAIRAALKTAY